MSKQVIFTCDRCGDKFYEVSYENESRIALLVDYHWDEVSTGHHLENHSYNLCDKCSKEFAKFIGNGIMRDFREQEPPNC